MSNKERYKGLDTLFAHGEVVRPDPTRPPLWVQKLNIFEMEECRLSAQAKRTLVTSALRRDGSIELEAVRAAVARMTRDRMLDGLSQFRYSRYVAEANGTIQAQAEWQERLNVADRANYDTLPADEQAVITDINRAYLDAVNVQIENNRVNDRFELEQQHDDELRETYVDEWVDQRGADAFIREMRALELMWSVRMCDAKTPDPGGEWDHLACDHARLYEDSSEVHALPDALKEHYNTALNRLNVPVRLAKGTASQQVSSELSRPPSEEEASAASIPEATPAEQGGTSA